MMTSKRKTVSVEIKPHLGSTENRPYWLAIVTTARGRCYFVTYAGDKPSEEAVKQAWAEDRQAFDPYCG